MSIRTSFIVITILGLTIIGAYFLFALKVAGEMTGFRRAGAPICNYLCKTRGRKPARCFVAMVLWKANNTRGCI